MELRVKIKKLHKCAITPTYSKVGDAGMDLTAIKKYFDIHGNVVYHTGLAIEIPEGYVGLLFPRSSVCKVDLSLSNSVGVIDSNYRGEIIVKFKPTPIFEVVDDTEFEEDKFKEYERVMIPEGADNIGLFNVQYGIGERIAQLIIMPYPKVEFEEVEELTQTERGNGGFGSTGK